MFRSALYEFAHDYAILGEESGEEEVNKNYLENQEQPELITKPINQHFQNFSKLLQNQKERQKRKSLMVIDTNIPRSTKSSFSPRKQFMSPNILSVDKIVQKVYHNTRSTNRTPNRTNGSKFYENQIRWLNRVKQSIQVKEEIQKQRAIQECSFKPATVNRQNRIKMISPKKCRKISYTELFNLKKK